MITRIEEIIDMKRNQKEELAQMKQKLENELRTVRDRLEQAQREAKQFQDEANRERENLKPLTDQIEKLKQEITAREKDYETDSKEYCSNTQLSEDTFHSVDKQQNTVENLQHRLNECQDEEKRIDEALNTKEQELQCAQKQASNIKTALEKNQQDALIAATIANPLLAASAIAAAKALIATLRGELQTTKNELQRKTAFHQKKVADHGKAREKMNAAKEKLEQEKTNLTDRNQALNQQKERKINQKLKSEVDNKQTLVERDTTRLKIADARVTNTQADYNKLKTQKTTAIGKSGKLSTELETAKKKYQDEKQKLAPKRQQIEAKRQAQNGIQTQINTTQQQIKGLEEKAAAKRNEESTIRGKIANIETTLGMLNKSEAELERDMHAQQKLLKENQ
ncbi:unnamed protein product [Didymodactylos carnosus]|uniref:Uncharacterized protein n=2 Tax=Didymodactylos carnosus TaxID=1234261 RepID=A0A8S2IAJ5_9BILA|nr:unnamed protein product [Didymodactylos carnosus]CAF3735645.1 unnamed protein product [Didymodactylos carnosus]